MSREPWLRCRAEFCFLMACAFALGWFGGIFWIPAALLSLAAGWRFAGAVLRERSSQEPSA